MGLFDGAELVADVSAAAASALVALAASLALCFSRRLSSLFCIIRPIDLKREDMITHCLDIISPVTGSLCVPAWAAASEDMLRQYNIFDL